jgi:hypothetical protein
MSHYEEDNNSEDWKNIKKSKTCKVNPAGAYRVSLTFKGIKWDISIESISLNDFKVTARSNVKVEQPEVDILKKYLQDEGFEEAARKHNLYW